MDAIDAAAIGLVNKVVPCDRLDATIDDWAPGWLPSRPWRSPRPRPS